MDPSFGNSTVVGAARESVCRQNLPSKLEMLIQMRRDHEVRSYLCAKQCLTLTRIHACTGIAGYFRVRWRPVRASILRSSKRAQVLALSKVHLPTSMHSAVTEWFAPSSCLRSWSALMVCRWYTIGQDCSHATNNWGRYLKPAPDGVPSSAGSRSSFRLGSAATIPQPADAADPPQPGQGVGALIPPDTAHSEIAAQEMAAARRSSPRLQWSIPSATPNQCRTTAWVNQTENSRVKVSPCYAASEGDTTRETDQHHTSAPGGGGCSPAAEPVGNSSSGCRRRGTGGPALQSAVPFATSCSRINAGGTCVDEGASLRASADEGALLCASADKGALLRSSWSNPASLVSALHGRAASLNSTRAFWRAQEGAAAAMAQGAARPGGGVDGPSWGTPREDEARSPRPQSQQQPLPEPATPLSSQPVDIGQLSSPDSIVSAVTSGSGDLPVSSGIAGDPNGSEASQSTSGSPFLSACSSFYSSHSGPSGTPDISQGYEQGSPGSEEGSAFSPSLPGVRSGHCHRYTSWESRDVFHTPATSSVCGAYSPLALTPFSGFGEGEPGVGVSPAGATPYASPDSADAVTPCTADGSRESRMDLGAFAGPNGDLMVPSFLEQWRSGRGRRGAQRDLLDVTGQYGCAVQ